MLKCTEEGTYDWVKATVEEEGIQLEYQVTESDVEGSDYIDDEGVMDWSNKDVQDVVASYLGVEAADASLIEVVVR